MTLCDYDDAMNRVEDLEEKLLEGAAEYTLLQLRYDKRLQQIDALRNRIERLEAENERLRNEGEAKEDQRT